MQRRRNSFKRNDLRRAVRSAREAGLSIARVEVDDTGKIAVVVGAPEPPEAVAASGTNPWDKATNDTKNQKRAT